VIGQFEIQGVQPKRALVRANPIKKSGGVHEVVRVDFNLLDEVTIEAKSLGGSTNTEPSAVAPGPLGQIK
jgi:hypothetical protein